MQRTEIVYVLIFIFRCAAPYLIFHRNIRKLPVHSRNIHPFSVFAVEEGFLVNLLQLPVFQVSCFELHGSSLVAGFSGFSFNDGEAHPVYRFRPFFDVFTGFYSSLFAADNFLLPCGLRGNWQVSPLIVVPAIVSRHVVHL